MKEQKPEGEVKGLSTENVWVIRMSAKMDVGQREEQEDSIDASIPEIQEEVGVLCALSDGIGGLPDGKKASQLVVERMVKTFYQSSIGDTPEQILLRGCYLAQEDVRAVQETPGCCGATLVAAIVRDGRCSFLSVGDSRMYLYRGGQLILLTRDQNRGAKIDMNIALGRLPETARTDAKRSAITAYMGMKERLTVDRSSQSFALGDGDRIALMSDGVFNVLSESEMADIMGLPEEQVANEMIDRTLAKHHPMQDNCSILVIDVRRVTDEGRHTDEAEEATVRTGGG